MAIERTLSIIKPDAVAKNVIGQIYARFEGAGLKVIAAKMVHLSQADAEAFFPTVIDPYIGRKLYGMFYKAGLRNIRVHSEADRLFAVYG